jgi:hypothetical protein
MSLAGVVAGVMLIPATAHAGTYSVYGCRSPAATPAAANGWAPDRQSDAFATNDCDAGGSLAVGLTGTGPWNAAVGAEQRFTAPPGTHAAFLRLYRRTTGLSGSQHGLAYYLYADDRVLDSCDPAAAKCTADLDGVLDIPGLDASVVRFKAGCYESYPDQCTSNGSPLRVEVPQIVVGLRDDVPPAVAHVAGTMTNPAGAKQGTLSVAFDAADTGGGLYRTIVQVDGQPAAVANVAGGDCTDAGADDTDPYEFLAAVPCPGSVNGLSASLDTRYLSNGAHAIEVLVEDAGGNRTPVLPARAFTIDNPVPLTGSGTPNGINADVKGRLSAWFDANHRSRLRNRYGRRVVVRGRLVNRRGKGIQGARLDVYHRLRSGKLKRLLKTGLKTRKGGKLTLILPLDLTTRQIVIAYRAKRPGAITSRRTLGLTVVSARGHVIHKRPGKLGRRG